MIEGHSFVLTGDPIADCYAYVARKNNALLIVADGVNWGDKSKIAARCAVGAAVDYIHESMFVEMNRLQTTTVSCFHIPIQIFL